MDNITSQATHSIKPLEPGTLLNGIYLIDSLQGQGRYGLVYLASVQQTGKNVALKEVCAQSSNHQSKFQQLEAALEKVQRLEHPNITKTLDFFYDDGRFFIVMEWFDGDSLNNAITYQKLSIAKRYYIAQQLISAIQHATKQGFIHGALSLDNIMINKSGKTVIVDYGLQLLTPDIDGNADVRQLMPMPPEDIKSKALPTSDWYAFGTVLFELMNKTAPFSNKSVNLHYQSKLSLAPIHKYNQFANLNPLLEGLLTPNAKKRLTDAPLIQQQFDRALTTKSSRTGIQTAALITVSLCLGILILSIVK